MNEAIANFAACDYFIHRNDKKWLITLICNEHKKDVMLRPSKHVGKGLRSSFGEAQDGTLGYCILYYLRSL
jgi:hypothetical protein